MSLKHLATGAAFPPLKDGTIRLYSMRFCPFAQRTRLVLAAKGIEHETVNCNLKNKPEWLFEKNPKGLVPVVEHGDKVLYESLIVNDYLDEVFPGKRSLNAKDPYQRGLDQIMLDVFTNKVSGNGFKVWRSKGEDKEATENLMIGLGKLEVDLKKRGTTFFGGSQPGMLDYNMWPLFERLHRLAEIYDFVVFGEKIPTLKTYVDNMLLDEGVKAVITPRELVVKHAQSMAAGNVQYDYDE
ncbi:glutathione S-transferase omega-1-like [Glandiceps talaboti]